MSGRVIAKDGEMVDQIAQAAYGRTAGAAEAVLAANPHLAGRPARLTAGTVVVLPDVPAPAKTGTIKLWD